MIQKLGTCSDRTSRVQLLIQKFTRVIVRCEMHGITRLAAKLAVVLDSKKNFRWLQVEPRGR